MRATGTRRWTLALSLGSILAASGCAVPPVPVRGLEARQAGDQVLVWWANPIDFDSVEVTPAGPAGGLEPAGRRPGFREGPAMTAFAVKEAGDYRIQATSIIGGKPATSETSLSVEKPADGLLGRDDLDLGRRPEPLDVVFVVHPGCPYSIAGSAPGDGTGKAGPAPGPAPGFEPGPLFRQMAETTLGAVFRSAVAIESEDELRRLETARMIISKNRLDPKEPLLRLIDPAACVVVDFRPAVEGGRPSTAPAQLVLRVLDLQLAGRVADGGAADRLYSQRPLIVEGYQEVGPYASRGEMFLRLRAAWKELLRETLKSPRYVRYRDAVAGAPGTDAESLRAAYFADLSPAWRPLPAKDDEFEARIRRIESEILFDPDPSRPPPAPVAPAAPEAPSPASAPAAAPSTAAASAAVPAAAAPVPASAPPAGEAGPAPAAGSGP